MKRAPEPGIKLVLATSKRPEEFSLPGDAIEVRICVLVRERDTLGVSSAFYIPCAFFEIRKHDNAQLF